MKSFPRISRLSERFRKSLKSDFAFGNGLVRSAKGIHLTASMIMLLSGLMLCIAKNLDGRVALWVISGCCILLGGADIFGYYSNDLFRLAFQFAFAFGSYSILFGILLLVMPEQASSYLPYVIGSYVVLDGLQKVQISLEGRKFGIGKWFLILGTSVIVVALGYLSVFFAEQNNHLWMGIAVAANGAENFWTTMYTVRVRTEKHEP